MHRSIASTVSREPVQYSVRRERTVVSIAALGTVILTGALSAIGCAPGGDSAADETSNIGNDRSAYITSTSVQFGTRCQQDYQNGWQVDVGSNDVWNRCGNFHNSMSWASRGFYYNLHGAKAGFENADSCGWGCGYVDSVDFFYTNTHGGTTSTNATWAMWDQNSLAFSSQMRLGASGRQNMVFASFACNTHVYDGSTWTRWAPVFGGGLVLSVGSHGSLYAGNTQSSIEFASRMRDEEPIYQAWWRSAWYADNLNQSAVIATGANGTDCSNRATGTKVSNLFGRPVLRDGAIGWWCQYQFN